MSRAFGEQTSKCQKLLLTNRKLSVKSIQNEIDKMPDKYFRNPFLDYEKETSPKLTINKVLNPNNKISLGLSAKWQLTLNKLQNLDTTDYSVYTGTAGIALLKLKKDPDDPENLQDVLNLLGLDKLRNKRHTFLCGDAGPLAIGIVVNHKLGRKEEVEELIKRLKSMVKDVLNLNSDLPNECMYGRAGYLYSILYINKYVDPPPFDKEFICPIIKAILQAGRNMAVAGNFKCPLMYQWHGSYYLGAAHGVSGILYMLLQAKEYLTEDEMCNLVKPTIDYLATLRFRSGNFPSSFGKDSDKYVQWCHGAPGFLYLFCKAYKILRNPEYLRLAGRCGEVIWERGLLKKGYSICHGVSGNAYCLLELYQTTRNAKYLHRALKFAEWCYDYSREHEQHCPDRPLSLYEGIVGPMYLMLDIQSPLQAKFPGFTL